MVDPGPGTPPNPEGPSERASLWTELRAPRPLHDATQTIQAMLVWMTQSMVTLPEHEHDHGPIPGHGREPEHELLDQDMELRRIECNERKMWERIKTTMTTLKK